MSRQAENKAERVKVEDFTDSPWIVYEWSFSKSQWDFCTVGHSNDRDRLVRWCSNPDPYRFLLIRYPGDPEALYFDAANPNGIPVEWDDEKTV